MEVALIIQADHGFNSSTFTARAVASTLANIYAATSAAVGALGGPLHGGASESVMQMLKDAKASGDPVHYYISLADAGIKIMGMGHRVYKSTDPRAKIFEDILEKLTPDSPSAKSEMELLRSIEHAMRDYFAAKGKAVFVNVDFWSGAVYSSLGIQPILFPGIFAAARMAGWCAHIIELRQNNRLYRPKSLYTGLLNVAYVPLEKRPL